VTACHCGAAVRCLVCVCDSVLLWCGSKVLGVCCQVLYAYLVAKSVEAVET